ncbi:MAG: glycerol-3-phosphate ABC transporter ATP-binding protein [Anaerolineae bacterium]|nr:ABC transporter ATP-binding protein [Anaerolineales bacterium]MCQ3979122.1 glycerol-3-phosphate ABC transporter ATP-binding protein [Anaerolineae bacterium]
MTDVTLQNVTKQFGPIKALNDVSFSIKDGEFFVLLGHTGAGKTTTLRVIAGLERQDKGHVLFDNQEVDAMTPADRDIAFVFQQYSLYPTMSVYDNLAFPLRSPLRRTPEAEIRQRVESAAEKLRISHLLTRKTARLSGGEMQRVSIGRAIVRSPRIFLMDEPLSNLDAKLREALRVELQHLQKIEGSTTLFVTHDQVEALTMADRIAVMKEGRIVQIGTPDDIYDRPATMFVAELVGTPGINLFQANHQNGALAVENSSIQFALGASAADLPSAFVLGVRPEDVQPDPNGDFSGQVTLIEPLGVETILHIKVGEQTLLSNVSGMTSWRIGDTIRFNIARERLHFFEPKQQQRIAVKQAVAASV